MAIRVMGAAPSRFPTVPDGTPAVLVVLGNQDPATGEIEYDVTTDIGYGLPSAVVVRVVGLALHQVAHALLSDAGQLVDVTDLASLTATAPAAPGPEDGTDEPRAEVQA